MGDRRERASEHLLAGIGFRAVTPPLDEGVARRLYRAAAALAQIDDGDAIAVGARVTDDGPELVVFGGRIDTSVESHGVTVTVRSIALDGPGVRDAAATCMPVRGIAWILDASGR